MPFSESTLFPATEIQHSDQPGRAAHGNKAPADKACFHRFLDHRVLQGLCFHLCAVNDCSVSSFQDFRRKDSIRRRLTSFERKSRDSVRLQGMGFESSFCLVPEVHHCHIMRDALAYTVRQQEAFVPGPARLQPKPRLLRLESPVGLFLFATRHECVHLMPQAWY